MMNDLCTDIGYYSLNKYAEQLCGDHVEVVEQGDHSVVVVLADGLGSGVKASILSTLTAKIISTMMANDMRLEECVATIAATLPVCSLRNIAYSTFTIIRIADNQVAEIIEYDNPAVILLRNGRNLEFDKTTVQIEGKTIQQSRIELQQGDTFIAMSDGAVHAGVGRTLNFGWRRRNIIEFMQNHYNPGFTAKTLTTILLNECGSLYAGEPGDDTTVCTVKIRPRRSINVVIGPPTDPADDEKMMSLFFSGKGKHIVCGGTTSRIAADYLGRDVLPSLLYADPEIPPTAFIEGVDLVTEGIITINRVLAYARSYMADNECYAQWKTCDDGASLISRLLFEEATDIHFYVGKAINPAHQNPDLPIHFNIKMRLVDELADCLRKMGKAIQVVYF